MSSAVLTIWKISAMMFFWWFRNNTKQNGHTSVGTLHTSNCCHLMFDAYKILQTTLSFYVKGQNFFCPYTSTAVLPTVMSLRKSSSGFTVYGWPLPPFVFLGLLSDIQFRSNFKYALWTISAYPIPLPTLQLHQDSLFLNPFSNTKTLDTLIQYRLPMVMFGSCTLRLDRTW